MLIKAYLKPNFFISITALALFMAGCSIQKNTFNIPQNVDKTKPNPSYTRVSYNEVINWGLDSNIKAVAEPLLASCRVFNNYGPSRIVTTNPVVTTAQNWQAVCSNLQNVDFSNNTAVREFLENNFTPYLVKEKGGAHVTGYYRPEFQGSLTKNAEFKYPVYQVPSDLIAVNLGDFIPQDKGQVIYGRVANGHLVKYYTRAELEANDLESKEPLLWLKSPIDVFLLQVQGSGAIVTPEGDRVYVMYAAKNGREFKGIYDYIKNKGWFTTKPGVKGLDLLYTFAEEHPGQVAEVLNLNPSFVFFKIATKNNWRGGFGTPMLPRRNVAVDPAFIALGAPLWLVMPNPKTHEELNHMVVANDIGSAIKGLGRLDFYWGLGKAAGEVAGLTNQQGTLYLFLPKS